MPKTKKEEEKKVKTTAPKTVKTNKTSTVKPAKTKSTKTKTTKSTPKKATAKKVTTKKTTTKKVATKKVKMDEKKEVLLQIIANLKTENKRLADWLSTHKLSKKDKEKIEDNIAFNENAITHFNEIIK